VVFCGLWQNKEDTISYLAEKGYDTDKDIKDMSIVNIGEDEKKNAVVVSFMGDQW